jgi:HD superfamily phosphohydrolase
MTWFTDRIFGAFDVTEAALLDLMDSAAVRRLEGVLQHGISGLVGVTRATSRLEHSLGVMLIVRQLGAGLEEQIAALLHDVSHTAFSHVVDYVFDGHDTQSYHEEKQEGYLAASDVPAILARHGYDWRDFLHEESFPLLEQPAPRLCADRLDYFLRDAYDLGLASMEQSRWAFSRLVVAQGRIACADLDAARWMAETYLAADQASWANFREVGLYELTARAIQRALSLGELSEADLWTTDAQAWAKLTASRDAEIRRLVGLVLPQTRFTRDPARPDFWVSTKLRTIDPEVTVEGELVPLSALDAAYAFRRREYLRLNSGKWPVKVLAL